MRRLTPLRRRKRPRPWNPERRAWLQEIQYGDHAKTVRSLPCCVCGHRPPSFAHHYKTRGSGGTKRHLTPLCLVHHDAVHLMGRVNFESCYGVNLEAVAKELWEKRRSP
jgi:hypothetical protein